jgi:hypothetical protein
MDGRKAAVALALVLTACGPSGSRAHGRKAIVLGVDGMDPGFLERHWDALPNLRRLRDRGGLLRLATTTPPQSPVAWATFITGLDPAQHGLFDFVLRDPATLQPISSMGQTLEPAHHLDIGPWTFPLSAARIRTFRRGRTFWEILEQHGIPATIMRMPTNYPPEEHAGEALSGMGTPDLEGTFGTFTYYTDDPGETPRVVSGGRIVPVTADRGRVILPVQGPPNALRRDHRPTGLEMIAEIDPDQPVARFQVGGRQFILREGEWSPWVRVRFPLIEGVRSVAGMFRVYARQLHPAIHIYRSPLNADPSDPALPISAPAGFSRELAQHLGPFYTQGIEEDTSALRQNALDLPEYLTQSRYVARQHRALLRECLRRFHDGLLFFYFSETDQDSHVLWGAHDDELLKTYQSVDGALGDVLRAESDATIMVMSDHGFSSFRRSFNLNSWLHSEGLDGKAYGMGLNALYLRKGDGAALAEIRRRLLEFRDPETGERVIQDVTAIASAGHEYAPDLIVGPAPGYRISWESALGESSAAILEDNTDAWIADHCIAAKAVPGSLLGTRRSRVADPALKDLPVTILSLFGVSAPAEMTGRDIYR